MTADIRTAARAETEATAHFGPPDFSAPNDRTIKWATYVQGFTEGAVWAQSRVTPTREQLIDVLRKHQHDYCEECHMSHGCTCGWRHKDGSLSTDEYDGEDPVGSISEHQAEVLLALMQGLAEGEG